MKLKIKKKELAEWLGNLYPDYCGNPSQDSIGIYFPKEEGRINPDKANIVYLSAGLHYNSGVYISLLDGDQVVFWEKMEVLKNEDLVEYFNKVLEEFFPDIDNLENFFQEQYEEKTWDCPECPDILEVEIV